jgi:chaperonin GroES
MTFKPLHDRLLVERGAEPPARSGAIVIPDSAKEKPQQGNVMAVQLTTEAVISQIADESVTTSLSNR